MSRARHRRETYRERLQVALLLGVGMLVAAGVLGGPSTSGAAPAPAIAPATVASSKPPPNPVVTPVPRTPDSTSVRLTTTPVRPALRGPFRSCDEALAAGLSLPFTRTVAVWNPDLDRDGDGRACES